MTDAIRVDALTKQYGALSAVGGIEFAVPTGKVFAFLGPNGAGKTTTVEILEGLRRRTSGTVEVLGLDPWSQGRRLHTRIGVIPQEFRFFDKSTPAEAIQVLCGAVRDPGRHPRPPGPRRASPTRSTRGSRPSPAVRSRSSGSPSPW